MRACTSSSVTRRTSHPRSATGSMAPWPEPRPRTPAPPCTARSPDRLRAHRLARAAGRRSCARSSVLPGYGLRAVRRGRSWQVSLHAGPVLGSRCAQGRHRVLQQVHGRTAPGLRLLARVLVTRSQSGGYYQCCRTSRLRVRCSVRFSSSTSYRDIPRHAVLCGCPHPRRAAGAGCYRGLSGHPSKHGANTGTARSRPLWKDHHSKSASGLRLRGERRAGTRSSGGHGP